jgi:hypothetical protein
MVKGDWRKADSKIESSVGQLMRSLIDEGKVSEGIWMVLELSDHGELGKILAKGAEIEVARAI